MPERNVLTISAKSSFPNSLPFFTLYAIKLHAALTVEPPAVASARPYTPIYLYRSYARIIFAAIDMSALIIGVLEFCIEKNAFDIISLYARPIIPSE